MINRKKTQRLYARRKAGGEASEAAASAPLARGAPMLRCWRCRTSAGAWTSSRRASPVVGSGCSPSSTMTARECLAAVVDTSISGRRVVRELDADRPARRPQMIVSDNGTELTSMAVLAWCGDRRSSGITSRPAGRCRTASSRASTVACATSCSTRRCSRHSPRRRLGSAHGRTITTRGDHTPRWATSPPASSQPKWHRKNGPHGAKHRPNDSPKIGGHSGSSKLPHERTGLAWAMSTQALSSNCLPGPRQRFWPYSSLRWVAPRFRVRRSPSRSVLATGHPRHRPRVTVPEISRVTSNIESGIRHQFNGDGLVRASVLRTSRRLPFTLCQILSISVRPWQLQTTDAIARAVWGNFVRIFDCMLYNGEIETLLIRLNEPFDLVDCFVIVELTRTFSGKRETCIFEEALDKTSPVLAQDLLCRRGRRHVRHASPWDRERFQRNSIVRGSSMRSTTT